MTKPVFIDTSGVEAMMRLQNQIIKELKKELATCGLPRNPALIVGRKFMFVSAVVSKKVIAENEQGVELLDKDVPMDEDRLSPYILFGTVTGIDFIPGEALWAHISPNETTLGKVARIWLNHDGKATLYPDTTGDCLYKEEYLHDGIRGRFALL